MHTVRSLEMYGSITAYWDGYIYGSVACDETHRAQSNLVTLHIKLTILTALNLHLVSLLSNTVP